MCSSDLIDSEKLVLSEDGDAVEQIVLACLSAPGDQGMRSAFPEKTALLDYTLFEGELTVNLSQEYGALFGPQLTIAEGCMTLSLCQIQGVENVTLLSGGKKNTNSERETGMRERDFVLDGKALQAVEREFTLYFSDGSTSYVVPETRNVVIRENESPERYVVEQLVKGPESRALLPTIPEGTKLLTIVTEQRKCYVNFSEELADGIGDDMSKRALLYYSVANSLTELDGIFEVEILVNGNPYGNLVRCGYAISPKAERMQTVTLYLAGDQSPHMVPVTLLAAGGGLEDADMEPAAVVMKLLAGGIDGRGCLAALPDGTRVLSCTTSLAGVCSVKLSGEYAGNMGGPEREICALDSIVLSLTALPEITSVRLILERAVQNSDLQLDYSKPFFRDESRVNPRFR